MPAEDIVQITTTLGMDVGVLATGFLCAHTMSARLVVDGFDSPDVSADLHAYSYALHSVMRLWMPVQLHPQLLAPPANASGCRVADACAISVEVQPQTHRSWYICKCW